MIILRFLFELLVLRPFVMIVIGLRVQHRERLPTEGPALIVANHNSHLDTPVLYSLFPLESVHRVRAVAAHDYWFSNPIKAWFSRTFLNLIPVRRQRSPGERIEDVLSEIFSALKKKQIVIFFPEGSRGEPEQMTDIRKGIDVIASRVTGLKIIPIFLHGLGKAMPRGDPLIVPFFCDAVIGAPMKTEVKSDHEPLSQQLKHIFTQLRSELSVPEWKY